MRDSQYNSKQAISLKAYESVSIIERLRIAARAYPDTVALEAELSPAEAAPQALTFQEWDRKSDCLARALAKQGIRPGDHVGLAFTGQWASFAVACFAVYKARAIVAALPVDPTDPRHTHLEDIVGRVRLRATLSTEPVSRIPGVENINMADMESDASVNGGAQRPGDFMGSLAFLDFTSGTTGGPKIVAFTHADLAFSCYEEPRIADLQRDDSGHARILVTKQMMSYHSPLILQMSLAAEGSSLIIAPSPANVTEFLKVISGFGITRAILEPHLLEQMTSIEANQLRPDDSLQSLRLVQLTGTRVEPGHLLRISQLMPHVTFMVVYGSTESGPAQTALYYRHDSPNPALASSVGKPIRSTQVEIRAAEGFPAPSGTVGEVWLRYRDAPDRRYYLADSPLVEIAQHGWIAMGDLGYLDSDGYLYLVGRKEG